MRSIFISYRRDDSEGEAGRLFDDLVQHFGHDAVFMDVADIAPGRDFRKAIDESITTCGVFLSIIGQNWIDAKNATGQRRLDDPGDFVRLETAGALKRDIPLVPVLIRGARMPRAEDLPDDLKELAYRNAIELTHARWASDLQLLLQALRPLVPELSAAADAAPNTGDSGSRDSEHARASRLVDTGGPDSLPSRSRQTKWLLIAGGVLVVLGILSYGASSFFTTNRTAEHASERQHATNDDVLTFGTWTLTKAVDDSGQNWGNSTLKFTSQEKADDGFQVAGFFEWRLDNALLGKEEFEGRYQPSQARIILEGKRIIPLNKAGEQLSLGSYSAKLSDDGRAIVDGRWGTVAGATDPNVRAQWEAAR